MNEFKFYHTTKNTEPDNWGFLDWANWIMAAILVGIAGGIILTAILFSIFLQI